MMKNTKKSDCFDLPVWEWPHFHHLPLVRFGLEMFCFISCFQQNISDLSLGLLRSEVSAGHMTS